jgi:hypothetical protein
MGGGDLNMKKSWHPLLQKNQERVWQEENRAREERKRIEQKRKEIAEERQLQELQRLQESQGGKPRQERLDWMYTAPGAGTGVVGEQMEQYLLGKRGVEELIRGDENEKLKRGAETAVGGGSAGGVANTTADTKNKVLADPLLAIKKQEQRKFEELMSNPIKLKEMKREMEKMNGSGKKEDKKHHKSHHRHRHRDRDEDDEKPRHRSEKRARDRDDDDDDYRLEKRYDSERRHRDRDDNHRSEKRSRDNDTYHSRGRRDGDDRQRHSTSHNEDRNQPRSPYRPSSSSRRRSPSLPLRDRERDRSPPRRRRPPPTIKREASPDDAEAKTAAVKAMLANAEDLESSRAIRLAALEEREREEREREERERERKKGLGGRAGFMRDMQNRILDEGRMTTVR